MNDACWNFLVSTSIVHQNFCLIPVQITIRALNCTTCSWNLSKEPRHLTFSKHDNYAVSEVLTRAKKLITMKSLWMLGSFPNTSSTEAKQAFLCSVWMISFRRENDSGPAFDWTESSKKQIYMINHIGNKPKEENLYLIAEYLNS